MHFYLEQVCAQKQESYENIITIDSLDVFKQFKGMMPLGAKTVTGKQRYILGEEQVYLHLFGTKPECYHEALFDCIYLLRILLYLTKSKQRLVEVISSTKSLPLLPQNINNEQTSVLSNPRKVYCCKICSKPLKGNNHATCKDQQKLAKQSTVKKRKITTLDSYLNSPNATGENRKSKKRQKTR